MRRRHALVLCGALALPGAAVAAPPYRRLAVVDPPYVEEYEALIAMSPPLARGTVGRLLSGIVTRADEGWKTEKLTRALDPQRTRLHERFVRELAGDLADAGVKMVWVPVRPARDEAELLQQVRDISPASDAVMMANVQGRYVAVHGLAGYEPWLLVGLRLVSPDGRTVWHDQIYSAGFSGIDPRAVQVEVDLPERWADIDAVLAAADAARDALWRAVDAVAGRVVQQLLK